MTRSINSAENLDTPSSFYLQIEWLSTMEFFLQPHEKILGGLILTLIFLYIVKNKANRYRKTHKTPPEPEGAWPMVGHLRLLGKEQLLHRTFGAMADNYGPVFGIRLGVHRAVVISSKETTQECFTSNDKVLSARPTPLPVKLVYDNFMFSFAPDGPYWRDIRKIVVTQLLSNHKLELQKHIRGMGVNCFIQGLYKICKEKGGPGLVEMKDKFADLAINIILRSVAGKSYDSAEAESRRCLKAFHEFDRLLGINYYSDAFPALGWMDNLNGSVRQLKRTAVEIDYFMSRWVKEHRQKKLDGKIEGKDEDFIDGMLSILDGGRPAEEVDSVIKATCENLVGAGNDTTSITLTWALSLLLNNPNVLKRAQDELDIHIGHGRQVDEADIQNLAYLQAILKETLRLYPLAPLSLPHEAMKDCTIAGFDVPKGTQLFVNLWKLHHDPSIWENPSQFIPERFLKEHSNLDFKGQNFEYIPFGSGRRMCPGLSFGSQVIHLALARLLHAFEFSTASDRQVDMTEGVGLTLPKDTPLEVVITPKLPAKLYAY